MPDSSRSDIDRSEWDFSGVPDEELLAACIYEHARSVAALTDTIALARTDQVIEWRQEILANIAALAPVIGADLLQMEGYPSASWRQLTDREKQALRRTVKWIHFSFSKVHKEHSEADTRRLIDELAEPGPTKETPEEQMLKRLNLERDKTDPGQPLRSYESTHRFTIDWRMTNAELLGRFAVWLTICRQEKADQSHNPLLTQGAGRGELHRGMLNCLGAARLMQFYGDARTALAATMGKPAFKRNERMGLYSSAPLLRQAATKALPNARKLLGINEIMTADALGFLRGGTSATTDPPA